MKTKKQWNTEKATRIAELMQEGKTVKQIAKTLKTTSQNVYLLRKKLNTELETRRPAPAARQATKTLDEETKTAIFGITTEEAVDLLVAQQAMISAQYRILSSMADRLS